jgi:Molybdopterin-binding domain of aldehyde dehydrogenase
MLSDPKAYRFRPVSLADLPRLDPGQYLRAREAEAMWTHAGPDTFPNGCMIAEVEVDPETGVVKIDRICSVDHAGLATQNHDSARFCTVSTRARRRPCVTMFGFSRQGR